MFQYSIYMKYYTRILILYIFMKYYTCFNILFEHIVKDKLQAYISANHLQDPNQRGLLFCCF